MLFLPHEELRVETRAFPAETRDFFPIEFILKHRCLPFGTKLGLFGRRRLNVGFCNPKAADIKAVKLFLKEKHPGISLKSFLIAENGFSEVIKEIYRQNPTSD